MEILNVFEDDAFSLISLTAAIQALPVTPGRIGQMAVFDDKPVRTTTVAVEETAGELRLIPDAARGTRNRVLGTPGRRMRNLAIPHMPLDAAVWADDVMGLRSFGTDDVMPAVEQLVEGKLQGCRNNHEVTHEYLRVGAIQGLIKNAQGDTIYNLFTEFGVSETSVNIDFGGTLAEIKASILSVIVAIENVLNGLPYSRIVAMCGTTAYEHLSTSEAIGDAMLPLDSRWSVELQRAGFQFANVDWFPYRGSVGSNPFIPATHIRFFPIGVPDFFQQAIAPGDFIDTVGTLGQLIYARQQLMDMNKGVEIHTQSNVLPFCTRPKALVKGVDTTV